MNETWEQMYTLLCLNIDHLNIKLMPQCYRYRRCLINSRLAQKKTHTHAHTNSGPECVCKWLAAFANQLRMQDVGNLSSRCYLRNVFHLLLSFFLLNRSALDFSVTVQFVLPLTAEAQTPAPVLEETKHPVSVNDSNLMKSLSKMNPISLFNVI